MFKGNKKPESEKGLEKETPEVQQTSFEEHFQNILRVPKALLDEFKLKGLQHRWINQTKWVRNGHYHKHYWQPYKAIDQSSDKTFGKDIDHYIRRGDLLLAVRPKHLADQHKEYLRKKNERHKRHQESAGQQLRAALGGKGKVITGYDNNGS